MHGVCAMSGGNAMSLAQPNQIMASIDEAACVAATCGPIDVVYPVVVHSGGVCVRCLPHVYNAREFVPCNGNAWADRDRAHLSPAALLCRPIFSMFVPCSLPSSILRREVDLTPLEGRICIPANSAIPSVVDQGSMRKAGQVTTEHGHGPCWSTGLACGLRRRRSS